MASIGSLTADLRLESAAFIRDLNKASQAVARNTASMQKSVAAVQRGIAAAGATFRGALAGFVTVATVRSLVNLRNTVIETASATVDAAKAMGVAAEDLQRLRNASQLAGVGTDELDAALKRFSANLSTGKIAAQGDTIAESFRNYIDQIRQAPDQLEKFRIAQEAAGTRGANTLLKIAAESAAEFNRNLEQTFVVSRRTLSIAERLGDEMDQVGNAISAGFSSGFLGSFNGTALTTDERLKEINETAANIGNVLGTAFQFATQMAGFYFDEISKIYNFDWSGLGKKIRDALPKPGLGSRFPGDNGDTSLFGVQASAAATGGTGAGTGLQASAEGIAVFNQALGEILDKTQQLRDANREWLERLAEGAPIFEATRTPLEALEVQLNNLSEAYAKGSIDAETFGRAQVMAAASAIQPWLNVADTIGGALGTLFKENKAVAIAQAVINTAQAITATLAQYGFTPIGIAASAAAAAAGAAQIAAITSANPGTSKTPKAKGGSVSASSTSSSRQEASAPVQDRSLFIHFQGEGLLSPEQVRGVISQINDAVKDGVRLVSVSQ